MALVLFHDLLEIVMSYMTLSDILEDYGTPSRQWLHRLTRYYLDLPSNFMSLRWELKLSPLCHTSKERDGLLAMLLLGHKMPIGLETYYKLITSLPVAGRISAYPFMIRNVVFEYDDKNVCECFDNIFVFERDASNNNDTTVLQVLFDGLIASEYPYCIPVAKLTRSHPNLIRHYADKINICYDDIIDGIEEGLSLDELKLLVDLAPIEGRSDLVESVATHYNLYRSHQVKPECLELIASLVRAYET